MKITISSTIEASNVHLDGRFDAFEVEEFASRIDALIAEGITRFHINLSDVDFIDSSGLAALVRAMMTTRELGGHLLLVNPSDPVTVILELTKLNAAFDIVGP